MESGNGVFRQESMERLNSPERLNDYIKVVSTGNWMILNAALILAIGFLIWGIFGKIEDVVQTAVVSDDTGVYCLISEENWEKLGENATITINDTECELLMSSAEKILVGDSIKEYAKSVGGLSDGQRVVQVYVATNLTEGVFTGKLLVETVSPLSFIWN